MKWKCYDNSFNSWIDKKDKEILSYKMIHFREPYTYSKSEMKVELNLCNYITKSEL